MFFMRFRIQRYPLIQRYPHSQISARVDILYFFSLSSTFCTDCKAEVTAAQFRGFEVVRCVSHCRPQVPHRLY